MTSLRFHIRFPENKIKEPIIYQIGHEFKVVTNVRRADVRETTGVDGSRTDRRDRRNRTRHRRHPHQRLRRRSH
jgi:hypothetical protein